MLLILSISSLTRLSSRVLLGCFFFNHPEFNQIALYCVA
uniref:Uncharacterized protein n=1 Tax=Arundo donax TaxID=35708 RepID=A0A0A9BLP2_ARUDO